MLEFTTLCPGHPENFAKNNHPNPLITTLFSLSFDDHPFLSKKGIHREESTTWKPP